MSLLEVRGLDAHYGAIHALQRVDLTVEKGEIVTLIGSNGAGKSSTLRVLSGLLRPTAGTVTFDGRSLIGLAPHAIVRLGIAHAPEGRGIFGTLTVKENLELGAYSRSDRAGIRADISRMMVRFPILGERAGQSAGTLSGGEQQMLAVGRALMARPKLLLLDEPSLGLAPQIVQTIFAIIREINQEGVTILLVEQNAHMALRVAHRGYVLETGEIKMTDDARVLAASDEVRKAYLGIG
ncbi:MAG: ABC transporter ATP-binding protein [Myxococcales bacterium]|nr:ABC transporter ATP-binding protein [Myxococcales bacterium]